MKHLFVRTLLAFMVALVLMVVTLTIVFLLGYEQSQRAWSRKKSGDMETTARDILLDRLDRDRTGSNQPGRDPLGSERPGSERLDNERPALRPTARDVPLFVYDPSMELLFSNRGSGRQHAGEELTPVVEKGKIQSLPS